jgi:hypothetical protein
MAMRTDLKTGKLPAGAKYFGTMKRIVHRGLNSNLIKLECGHWYNRVAKGKRARCPLCAAQHRHDRGDHLKPWHRPDYWDQFVKS